jgi:subtilase family serine protease
MRSFSWQVGPGRRSARVRRRGATWFMLAATALTGAALVVQTLATAPAAVGLAHSGSGTAGQHAAATADGPAPASGYRRACPWPPAPGDFSCFTLYQPQVAVNRALAEGLTGAIARPHGLTPRMIESAYRLPVSRRSHQTVAVSIAFNTPHLAQYLAHYRRYFGLPSCTQASGCFRVVNQAGKRSPLPFSGAGSGWDLEATLDVSMISVACPHCRILVVEADDNEVDNLAATDRTAARLGAQVISNSYGQAENGLAMTYARDYREPGHTVVVAAGDIGFTTANFPADLTSVTAVGGTQLLRTRHGHRGWVERVWNDVMIGAGSSGCSAYVGRPRWQPLRHCPGRTVSDVSAVAADVPIYNPVWGGWVTVDGTSIAAPLIAGIYGLAGNASKVSTANLYRHAGDFFTVTRGNNAWPGIPPKIRCGDDYLCVATPGYNAPAGLGTPDGIGAF